MRPFAYERPTHLDDALALLASAGPDGRVLAGGTDLIIRLRDGSARPRVVVDLKRVAQLDGGIAARSSADGGGLRFGARTTMTEIAASAAVRGQLEALVEAAAVVGSVQIRNRATLVGNQCNASPAADTAPSLLVAGARLVLVGQDGRRRIALDDFFVRSGVTTLRIGEVVEAIEVPAPMTRRGTVHLRRTRRRGHDLASVTLACAVEEGGVTRLAYGSVGPRPRLVVDETGRLADPRVPESSKAELLRELFVDASPSPTSLRAGPDYRLAMLHLLGLRGIAIAIERLRAMGAAA